MADPVTIMAGIGMAGSAAGGILGAIGAGTTGAANSAMYAYKGGMALINKQINDQNANWALQEGEVSAEEKGLAGAQTIADTKVTQAAGGFDVNTGTNAAVRDAQATAAGYDQSVIRWNAAKTAYGFETKAAADQAESTLDTFAASQAKTAGDLGIVSSILGGVTSVASKWAQAKSIGIGTSGSNPGVGLFDPNNYGAQPTWGN